MFSSLLLLSLATSLLLMFGRLVMIFFCLLSMPKMIIIYCRHMIACTKRELYLDGNGDSKCFNNKPEGGLISDHPNNNFGSK